QTLEEVLQIAKQTGYDCVELMCWPPGKANRRYAGVTHLDVSQFTSADAENVQALCRKHGIGMSGLGYYPNPLDPDPELQAIVAEHLKKVITAARLLKVSVVNTFIGRDWKRSIDDQWEIMKTVWRPIVDHAEISGV